ncbi:MAG: ParB/RepB/Spo0J family partition protein [Alphaproteobacteria bacterium]|nr:ParB/RepB/Spo0J family partition protein [Alphaproteobacteria bacterium]
MIMISPQQKQMSVFWVATNKVRPNPYQPRKEFSEHALEELANSIRRYGVLQPLVVTKIEEYDPAGHINTYYELIAGERRLRASQRADLREVPVLIREGQEENRLKLEMAIIENLHREDLNPIDRAKAFKQLTEEFSITHAEVAERVGKSREYISNSIRLLQLPDDMAHALAIGKMSEGHARILLMLTDKPDEQRTLFTDIVFKRLTVRDAERVARFHSRKSNTIGHTHAGSHLRSIEESLSATLGTEVRIEEKIGAGGVISITFPNEDILRFITEKINKPSDANERPFVSSEQNNDVDFSSVSKDDDLYGIDNFSL